MPTTADPRLADEICIASKSIRILRQLRFKQALGQHMTERSPDVAPVFFVGVNGVLHQIVGVLTSRVREAGRIQFGAAAVAVVDLDRTARRTSAVAAIGIARPAVWRLRLYR